MQSRCRLQLSSWWSDWSVPGATFLSSNPHVVHWCRPSMLCFIRGRGVILQPLYNRQMNLSGHKSVFTLQNCLLSLCSVFILLLVTNIKSAQQANVLIDVTTVIVNLKMLLEFYSQCHCKQTQSDILSCVNVQRWFSFTFWCELLPYVTPSLPLSVCLNSRMCFSAAEM